MNMMFVFCVTEEQPKEHCGHYEMTARHRYALLVRASCNIKLRHELVVSVILVGEFINWCS